MCEDPLNAPSGGYNKNLLLLGSWARGNAGAGTDSRDVPVRRASLSLESCPIRRKRAAPSSGPFFANLQKNTNKMTLFCLGARHETIHLQRTRTAGVDDRSCSEDGGHQAETRHCRVLRRTRRKPTNNHVASINHRTIKKDDEGAHQPSISKKEL